MDIKTIRFEKINEIMHMYEHSSGLKAFVIPKKGYSKKYATFATHYGSINNEFVVPGEKEAIRVPDGIAHFLEHKLFEQKDGSVMDKFSALGSSPNAYTSFNQTVYLFSCTEKFDENFQLLLNYVQNPYITDESVEKEKGIIGQEIQMYQDNPAWRVFFNLLDCLYVKHPVKIEIAGTIESISKINKELLYDCYNTFYTPSNMAVVVVGDADPDSIFSIVDEMIHFKDNGKVEKQYPDEPKEINMEYKEQKLAVSMPLFNMGVKDNARLTGFELLKRRIALGIGLYHTMGRRSDLYSRLYEERLINDSFQFDVSINKNYGYLSWGGQSPDPKKTAGIISEAINEVKSKGIGQEAFDRIKKSQEGMFIRSLNSVDNIAREIMDSYFNDTNFFDVGKAYSQVDIDYTNSVFREVFENRTALAVINPL